MLLVKDLLGEQIRLAHRWMANWNYLYHLHMGKLAVNMRLERGKHRKGNWDKWVGRFCGCGNLRRLGAQCWYPQGTLPLLHNDGDKASQSDDNLAMHIKGFVLFQRWPSSVPGRLCCLSFRCLKVPGAFNGPGTCSSSCHLSLCNGTAVHSYKQRQTHLLSRRHSSWATFYVFIPLCVESTLLSVHQRGAEWQETSFIFHETSAFIKYIIFFCTSQW